MGQEVVSAVLRNDKFETICGFDRLDTGDNNFPVYTDTKLIKETPDVIIDFSIPVATFKILDYALEKKIPVVIATTGFNDEELEKIKEYSKHLKQHLQLLVPFFRYIRLLILLSFFPPNFRFILLVQIDAINKTLNNEKYYEYNRHDKREKRNPKEIGIHSIRGGNIVGEHTVSFFTETECFKLTHTAQSRGVFADGSLKAAEFLVVQDPGFYNMDNIFSK